MPPRLFVDRPLEAAADLVLPGGAARHVQVLRLQPGSPVTLFDGDGREWPAIVVRIGRSEVAVTVAEGREVDRELATRVTLVLGMPANERMDAVIEKATELGVARVQPLVCERSVLRLAGERADKKVAHWRAVAIAACEQCGRTRVPSVEPVRALSSWLEALSTGAAGDDEPVRWLLSPHDGVPLPAAAAARSVVVLSGPEGGFSDAEERAARRQGFVAVSLGPRVLRADTAPLAALARIGAWR